METPPPPTPSPRPAQERIKGWVRGSLTLKLFIVGFLVLVLLIPTTLMQSMVRERQQTRDEAISEISSKWGGEQTVSGPVLSVPYRTRTVNSKTGQEEESVDYAYFFPEALTVSGSLTPEKRNRGIYVVMLYNARLHISGRFAPLNTGALSVPASAYDFSRAQLSLSLSDLKGIRQGIALKWDGQSTAFEPGLASNDLFSAGVSLPVALKPEAGHNFSFDLNLNGSGELRFLPLGKTTTVALTSGWSTPSFTGSFLPEQKQVGAEGFTARWRVLDYNRNYPQQGVGAFLADLPKQPESTSFYLERQQKLVEDPRGSFGVRLLLPVDEYQKTNRSAKYSVMFVILTFTVFFFAEVLNGRRIHPIQYLLVGFAICLFYVLLLSISEHLNFNKAYLISCGIILSMVFLYTRSVFRNLRLTLIFNGILVILYGFFYSLLQLEDYALLLGSLGLALVLAVVMYLTRRVDWYGLDGGVNAQERA